MLLRIKEILVDFIYDDEPKFVEKIKKSVANIGAFECLKVFNIRTKTVTFYDVSYNILGRFDFNSAGSLTDIELEHLKEYFTDRASKWDLKRKIFL